MSVMFVHEGYARIDTRFVCENCAKVDVVAGKKTTDVPQGWVELRLAGEPRDAIPHIACGTECADALAGDGYPEEESDADYSADGRRN